jgi:CO dehydrogenase maturation factor
VKLAITGKGGAGKTLLTATLARLYATEGRAVYAIDADPSSNLAMALAFPPEVAKRIIPISKLAPLLEERVADAPVRFVDGVLQVTPEVGDLGVDYAVAYNGVRLLKMGAIPAGGSGCACAINSATRALMHHLLLDEEEVLLMDMVAGVEHLGRATADAVDAMLVMVVPGRASLQIAHEICRLAADINLTRIFAVANRVRTTAEQEAIAARLGDIPLLGALRYDPAIVEADLDGVAPFDAGLPIVEEIRAVRTRLDERLADSV